MSRASRLALGLALLSSAAFAQGMVYVVLTTALQLLSPWILKYAIDDLAGGRPVWVYRVPHTTLPGLATPA